MPPLPNNTAARLATVLEQIRSTPERTETKALLTSIFGTGTDADFAEALSYFCQMPGEIERQVRALDEEEFDVEFFLQWVPPVNAAFTRLWSLTSPINSFQQAYSPTDIMNLRACSQTLHREKSEPRIAQSQIDDLRQQVQELIDALHASTDLPAELKICLIEQLDKVLMALRQYSIRGPRGLNAAVDTATGAAVRACSNHPPHTPEAKRWVQRFGTVLNNVAAVIVIAGGALAIPVQAESALQLFSGDSPATTQNASENGSQPDQNVPEPK
ncbi:hypothetical protein HG717_37390 [Rhodococcus erythropolis]|uniref:hypothetical protein n=1 Tax=Rhodococcus erythropolis TaxID=1833 RepID=UPI001C9AC95B|nr:hypothetical protein [Rhodococcus erythropolis]MBY6389543.1 hypothetical protein [Rhodococcus erythropolis]